MPIKIHSSRTAFYDDRQPRRRSELSHTEGDSAHDAAGGRTHMVVHPKSSYQNLSFSALRALKLRF